jgi:nitronate monooxygenase
MYKNADAPIHHFNILVLQRSQIGIKETPMIKTRITELLGIKYPILGGTMMHLSRAELVGAISEAGGLGVMASAIYHDKESFRSDVRKCRHITTKPIAVNLNMFPAIHKIDNNEYIDVILDDGIPVVETSGHKAPEEYVDRLKKNEVIMIHKCVGVRYALKAQSLGVDAVTVVGYENGGATGTLDITTLCLVPRIVDALKIPVIGGGGVCDVRGLMALLSLGAEGVIMGTRLLVAEECPLHPNIKQGLINATELDTMLVLRSLNNTHRVWVNGAARNTVQMEALGFTLKELMTIITGENAGIMYAEGNRDAGLLPCGQGVGLVKKVQPGREIIEEIMREAVGVQERLKALLS